MPKLLTRIRVWIFLALVALILVTTLIINVVLNTSKSKITQATQDLFTHDVTVSNILYLFPSVVIIKDVAFTPKESASEQKSLVFSNVVAKFSVLQFIKTREFSFKEIRITDSKLNYYDFQDFLSANAKEIIEILKQIPKEDVKMGIKNISWNIRQTPENPNYVKTDFHLLFRGDNIKGGGFFDETKFHFKGAFIRGGFTIDQLILGNDSVYSNLWGEYNTGLLKLKGYTFAKTATQEAPPEQSVKNKFKDYKDKLSEFFGLTHIKRLSYPNIFLLDVDSIFELGFPEVLIKRLNFTLNNDPVRINGKINLEDTVACDLAASYQPVTKGSVKYDIIDLVNLKVSGKFEKIGFISEGLIDIQFKKPEDVEGAIKKGEFQFKGLLVGLDESFHLKVKLDKGRVSVWSKEGEHKVSFKELNTFFNYEADAFKYINVHARAYGGRLHGRVWVDSTKLPLKVSSVIFLDHVNANSLGEMLQEFQQVYGKLSSRITMSTHPHFKIKGKMKVHDGRLVDYEFFKWLAESFDMPSLREVDFAEVSTDFFVNYRNVNLENIFLDSADVKVSGYFRDRNSLVSSKLSLVFSRDILSGSQKFRPIIKMFEANTSALNFDFQLSGNIDAMNFQWLDSDVKRRIQARIPNFIERKIERGIDAMIETPEEKMQIKEDVTD